MRTQRSELSEADFQAVSKLAYDEAGLVLPASKKAFVYSRLQKRLRHLKLGTFEDYCALLRQNDPDGEAERINLISALTTNVTQFFREAHHFELFGKEVLPGMVEAARKGDPVRIWSAGCSAGQEPFTIAAYCLKHAPQLATADFRVLASDIDPNVLHHGVAGVYPKDSLPDDRADYFSDLIEATENPKDFRFKENIKKLIAFRKLNLLRDWPFSGRFDAIFCRNVAIYFDLPTQQGLFEKFGKQLKPKGWLFVGHSERVNLDTNKAFRSAGLTSYQRTE